MKKSLLELDPDADALLILHCPNLQEVCGVKERYILPKNVKVKRNPARGEARTKASASFGDIAKPPYDEYGNTNKIEFRVSAKHLCLASPVFRKMLKGNFQESRPNDDGLLEIKAQGWNAQALLILLDVIHGHNLQVDRKLDLHTLAQIGLLVDYYDCFEIVEVFSGHWLWSLPEFFPFKWPAFEDNSTTSFGETEVLLLFNAWTFRETVPFMNIVYSAIYRTSNVIETHLPIPVQIVDMIEQQRTQLLEERFRQLYNLLDDVSAGKVGCSPQYSYRLRDYLLRLMRNDDLPFKKPEHPYVGFSVASMNGFMKGIRTPSSLNGMHKSRACKLETRINLEGKSLSIFKPGLNLVTSTENIFCLSVVKDPAAGY